MTSSAQTVLLVGGSAVSSSSGKIAAIHDGSAILYGFISDDTRVGAGNDGVMNFLRAGVQVGNIGTTATTTSYNTSSGKDLKDFIRVAVSTDVLKNTVINDFTWKADGSLDRGVFAQDAMSAKPSAVVVGDDTLDETGKPKQAWLVDYSKYVPDLIVGWQDHERRFTALKAEFDAYKAAHP